MDTPGREWFPRQMNPTAPDNGKVRDRCTVLLAVDPVVLEGALAALITRAQFAEVVQAHSYDTPFTRRYDAAVVSGPRPKGLRAGLTIELNESGMGRTRVRCGRSSRWENVSSHHDILEIVRWYCSPGSS